MAMETLEAWAMDGATWADWAMALALEDMGISLVMAAMDLYLALEGMDMAGAAHPIIEAIDSLTSTEE